MRVVVFTIMYSLITQIVLAQVYSTQDLLRMQFEADESNEAIEFFELEYRTATIDLNRLANSTEYVLPQSIRIDPPNLFHFHHVVTLVGLSGPKENPTISIWLAGNYKYRDATFYFDTNGDRNFNNDGSPIKISKKSIFQLRPDYQRPTISESTKETDKQMTLKRITNGFAIAGSVGIGAGKLEYQYDDLSTGFPVWYEVNYVEKLLTIAISYDTRKLQFGFATTFENDFYYSSHLNVKKGEPFTKVLPDPTQGLPNRTRSVRYDNIVKMTNADTHGTNKILGSVFVAYKIWESKLFDLQPRAAFGSISYLDPQYLRLNSQDNEVYTLKTGIFYEVGVRSEITTGDQSALFLEVVRSANSWKPENFLYDTPHENLTSKSTVLRFKLGYRIALKR